MCVRLTRSYRRGSELKQRNTRKASPQKLSQCKRVIGRYFSAKNANPRSVSGRGLANKRPAENFLERCCSADKSQMASFGRFFIFFIFKNNNSSCSSRKLFDVLNPFKSPLAHRVTCLLMRWQRWVVCVELCPWRCFRWRSFQDAAKSPSAAADV